MKHLRVFVAELSTSYADLQMTLVSEWILTHVTYAVKQFSMKMDDVRRVCQVGGRESRRTTRTQSETGGCGGRPFRFDFE